MKSWLMCDSSHTSVLDVAALLLYNKDNWDAIKIEMSKRHIPVPTNSECYANLCDGILATA